ncbi:MAG TPA: isochorismate synthase [Gemmatimonadaceae bacterium]|nr:isochorismate synthase [Gemmatimonadaceae bacterium]
MSASPRPDSGDITLVELLHRAASAARNRPVLATFVEPLPALDPLDAFDRAEGMGDRVYWSRPGSVIAMAGIGAAATISPSGEERFATAARQWRALLDGSVCDGPGAPRLAAPDRDGHPSEHTFGRRPMLVGGFRFDRARPPAPEWLGFPDSWLMVPRLCLSASPSGRWLATSALVKRGDDPERLADALERDRDRLLGAGPGASAAEAWATIAESMRGRSSATELRTATEDEEADDDWSDTEPSRTAFMHAVAEGAAAVRNGALEKVVTARAVEWRPRELPRVSDTLRRLEERHAECIVFAVARGGRTFLGASPERLVKVDGRTVRATSLAGSIARGSDVEDDARRAAALMHSAKDRQEHDIVVRALTTELAELCDAVTAPAAPALLTLRDVHHLYTPITAHRREGTSILRIIERLHPTPAVGGAPREEALAFIREHEGWDRGWYAAPVGWMDSSGDGEFAVALRSALMDGDRATLFAGCGIVADSVPEDEYAESELKLRAMREALEGGEVSAS